MVTPNLRGEKLTDIAEKGSGVGSRDIGVDVARGGATRLTTPALIPYFLMRSSVRAFGCIGEGLEGRCYFGFERCSPARARTSL